MLPRGFVRLVGPGMTRGWGRQGRPLCRLGQLSRVKALDGVLSVEEEEEEAIPEWVPQEHHDWNMVSAKPLSCRWAHRSSSAAAAAADEAAAAAAACCCASVESLALVDAS